MPPHLTTRPFSQRRGYMSREAREGRGSLCHANMTSASAYCAQSAPITKHNERQIFCFFIKINLEANQLFGISCDY